EQKPGHLPFIFDVLFTPSLLNFKEWWLSNIDMAVFDESTHLAVKEGQKERSDVRPINIGVGHDNDFVISKLRYIEVILPNTGTERGDHGHDFLMRQHFVVSSLFDVQDLSFDR